MSRKGRQERSLPQKKEPEEHSLEAGDGRTLKTEAKVPAAKGDANGDDGKKGRISASHQSHDCHNPPGLFR
jgi:hypothetical protein